MKLIFTCGGTSGHVSPALAIAEEIKSIDPECEILFICRESGYENKPILKSGYDVKYLNVRGIERRITTKNIKSIALALSAEKAARRIISDFKADAVVGTGGYVCWPVLHAANSMKIPTILHESNAVAGLVTRLLAKRTTRVILNAEECAKYLKRKDNVCVLGNPLSKKFYTVSRKSARKKLKIADSDFYILSYGGSGGAQKMNDVIADVIKSYSSKEPGVKHLHATGARYFKTYGQVQHKNCRIVPYIENMHEHLAAADVVICRCGAMTLSEIEAVGTPAILIPSPNVTDNHQYENGRVLEKHGTALMIEEKNLDKNSLIKAINDVKNSKKGTETQILSRKNRADLKSREKIAKEVLRIANHGRA